MAKTVLDLTPEELSSYRPVRNSNIQSFAEDWEKAWKDALTASHLLRERFGATRVVAFGSLAHRAWFTSWSDIDLAAWGISDDLFYQAVAAITGISSDFEVNLVDPQDCRQEIRQVIELEGIDL